MINSCHIIIFDTICHKLTVYSIGKLMYFMNVIENTVVSRVYRNEQNWKVGYVTLQDNREGCVLLDLTL